MKSNELVWIGLALAAGYFLSRQYGQPAYSAPDFPELPAAAQAPGIVTPINTPVKTNQKPGFDTGPDRATIETRRDRAAIAGHRCRCRRNVYRRYSAV